MQKIKIKSSLSTFYFVILLALIIYSTAFSQDDKVIVDAKYIVVLTTDTMYIFAGDQLKFEKSLPNFVWIPTPNKIDTLILYLNIQNWYNAKILENVRLINKKVNGYFK